MKIYRVTLPQLEKALAMVNEGYAGNVIFDHTERKNQKGTTWQVRLKVKSSRELGHRAHYSMGRRTRVSPNACWHVHGHFFDALLKIAPDAYIRTGRQVINRQGGNWQDYNIGSIMYPLMFSDSCDCGEHQYLTTHEQVIRTAMKNARERVPRTI